VSVHCFGEILCFVRPLQLELRVSMFDLIVHVFTIIKSQYMKQHWQESVLYSLCILQSYSCFHLVVYTFMLLR